MTTEAAPGPLRLQTERFLTHLRATRNYSPHTLRAYGKDLSAFVVKYPDLEPGGIVRVHVRAFLADLQKEGGWPGRRSCAAWPLCAPSLSSCAPRAS